MPNPKSVAETLREIVKKCDERPCFIAEVKDLASAALPE